MKPNEPAPRREDPGDVTVLLGQVREGNREAFDRLFPLVYEELRRIAGGQLRRERPGHTLQPTAVVNEAYLKLVRGVEVEWQDRAHFVAVASRAMRQVLVDHARRMNADKRGGGTAHTTLTNKQVGLEVPTDEILALDSALDRLEALEPRLRRVVEYRFFGGLTEREIGELLGVTHRTAQRDWAKARAWLYKELYPQ